MGNDGVEEQIRHTVAPLESGWAEKDKQSCMHAHIKKKMVPRKENNYVLQCYSDCGQPTL